MEFESIWSGWGNVPDDGDVIPFSHARVESNSQALNKKRHHFISVTYMNGFTSGGRIWVYRGEEPSSPLHIRPSAIGLQKYYYSQKLPDGTQDHHRFEDLWSTIETVWPATISAIAGRRLSHAISFNALGMATIMRVRVPAARERNELLLAAKLRAEVQALESIGKLPAELKQYAGKLDTVPVGINPQRTLAAMAEDMNEFGNLCFRLGFEVLHNSTRVPFISSDNPVCVYDPNARFDERVPYHATNEIELVFPLDAQTLLRGSSRLGPKNEIVRHRTLINAAAVRRLNRTVAQFAYRLVITPKRCDALACRYSQKVPTVDFEVQRKHRRIEIVWQHMFVPRPSLSLYVDTPEKAARVEAQMAQAFAD